MLCQDDIGRDSWDWVGPLLGREHDSTPQGEVEAPRLSKTEPPQIVLLWLLLFLVCCCWCVVVVVVVFFSKKIFLKNNYCERS